MGIGVMWGEGSEARGGRWGGWYVGRTRRQGSGKQDSTAGLPVGSTEGKGYRLSKPAFFTPKERLPSPHALQWNNVSLLRLSWCSVSDCTWTLTV